MHAVEWKSNQILKIISFFSFQDNGQAGSSTTPKKRPRKRSVRDKNAPVQPPTGYVRFMHARRPQVVKEHPELSNIEICKLVGADWQALSAEEKQVRALFYSLTCLCACVISHSMHIYGFWSLYHVILHGQLQCSTFAYHHAMQAQKRLRNNSLKLYFLSVSGVQRQSIG